MRACDHPSNADRSLRSCTCFNASSSASRPIARVRLSSGIYALYINTCTYLSSYPVLTHFFELLLLTLVEGEGIGVDGSEGYIAGSKGGGGAVGGTSIAAGGGGGCIDGGGGGAVAVAMCVGNCCGSTDGIEEEISAASCCC